MWRRVAFAVLYGWPFVAALLVASVLRDARSLAVLGLGTVAWWGWAFWFVATGREHRLKTRWRLPLLIWEQPDLADDGTPSGAR